MEILEVFFKAFFKNAATGEIAFFLGGFLCCLFYLSYYLKFFDNWDEHRDLLRELAHLLKDIRESQRQKKLRDRIQKGEEISDNF
jgi:hypothetical protein